MKSSRILYVFVKTLNAECEFVHYRELFEEYLFWQFSEVRFVTSSGLADIPDSLLGYCVLNDSQIFDFSIDDLIQNCFNKMGVQSRRLGWYRQQFLKLGLYSVCEGERYTVWDGDTIPLRKLYLFDDKKPILNVERKWRNINYDKGVLRVLGVETWNNFSFISEFITFDVNYVKEMLLCFGSKLEYQLYNLFLLAMKDGKEDCFSEFELYGNFITKRGYISDYRLYKFKSIRSVDLIFPFQMSRSRKIAFLVENNYDFVSLENHKTSMILRLYWAAKTFKLFKKVYL